MNLKELSKVLKLSISTVSKALNDSSEISAATKKKVVAKAKALNYHANPFASNLRSQKSKTIAVIIPAIANNFFSLAINGAESYAQGKDYHVLIYQTHEELQKEIAICKHLYNGRVDGIMVSLTRQTNDTAHFLDLKKKGIPLVFFDRVAEKIDAPKITTDDYESAFIGMQHLLKTGCKKIAFLSISDTLSISNKRHDGFIDALKKHKIKPEKNLMLACDNDENANKKKIKKLLTQKNKPDAIFACVEELAIASYEICEELKIKIPQDVKIISYSNLQTASILNPALTTITQPAYEIGRKAASILFRLINKKEPNLSEENTVLKSTLIVRKSTGEKK
ncbi:MAG: LacI family DNA-binding transcriptional regulator [Ferruginibacter sp.]|nr:LacI family DNA-binding transcriptional regulator [Ferruginibacter sp.]